MSISERVYNIQSKSYRLLKMVYSLAILPLLFEVRFDFMDLDLRCTNNELYRANEHHRYTLAVTVV